MGLGLPIARSIIEAHNGAIRAETSQLLAEPGLSSSCLRALPRAYD
jgi:signal transduction histidine kinase